MVQTTQKIPAGYKQTEVGVIPEDWEVKRLGDIGDTIIGLTYSPNEVGDCGKLVHRSSNIQKNKLSYDDNVYVDKAISEKLILKENDILVCVRNGSRDLIGKSVLIKGKSVGETFGAFMSVFRSNKCQPFIYYLILSNLIQRQINQSLGATINQITNKTLNNFQIPYPQKSEEQSAIATVLSDVDALIEKLEKLIAKKRAIKQGAMQELLTGKKRLPGFSGEWEIINLGKVAEFMRGRGLSKSDMIEDGTYKCIHYGQLFAEYKELIREVWSGTNRNEGYFYSRENDVLMPTSDVTPRGLATASCIKESGVILSGGILIVRLHAGYDGLYFSYFVTQNKISILKLVKGSTVFHLYANDLATIEVRFPKLQEQIAIAQILSDMDSEIEELEQKLNKYRMLKQGMMQELLAGKTRLL